MTDKSLLDRWRWMAKIAPNGSNESQRSWNENTKNLLSTEKKIYAIKISDGEIIANSSPVRKKKLKSLPVKKWLERCPWQLPKVMILFSAIQIFFHTIGSTDSAHQILAFSPVRKLELWRYFTYSLLHANTAHLAINVILQLFIALPLESEVGPLAVIFVYIGGILSGSLAASVTKDFSLMVGASSGIYSLLMSHVAHIFMNFSSLSYRVHRIIVVAVLSISDIIYAVIHCMEHREPQIAIPSHIAGALCGILLGFIFYESHRHQNREGNLLFKVLKWTSMAFLLCFVAFVVAINVIAV